MSSTRYGSGSSARGPSGRTSARFRWKSRHKVCLLRQGKDDGAVGEGEFEDAADQGEDVEQHAGEDGRVLDTGAADHAAQNGQDQADGGHDQGNPAEVEGA